MKKKTSRKAFQHRAERKKRKIDEKHNDMRENENNL